MPTMAIGIDASSNECEASSSMRALEREEGSWTGSPGPSNELIAMVENYEWRIHTTTLTYSHVTGLRQRSKGIIKFQTQQTNVQNMVIARL
jgi:hypothetical protein